MDIWIGKSFGKLTVVDVYKRNGYKIAYCLCSCGLDKSVYLDNLRTGNTQSCGCAQYNSRGTHKYSHTKTYRSWISMRQRCLNPNATKYKDYGKMGILVCERWHLFNNFLQDMGERPINTTLDRKNPYGNYEPNNCKWSSPKEQANNKKIKRLKEVTND
jgi:hypothetical protein